MPVNSADIQAFHFFPSDTEDLQEAEGLEVESSDEEMDQ